MIQFFVPGIPVPQGSKSLSMKGGRAVMFDQNASALKSWRNIVHLTGVSYRNQYRCPVYTNVNITLIFYMGERPKSHYTKTGKPSSKYREYPNVKPDIDKLTRAILDALTGVFYQDDSQVITINCRKLYGQSGVKILIDSERTEG